DKIGWQQNIRVFASSGQDWTSHYTHTKPYNSDYTRSLVAALKSDPEVRGFEGAQAILEGKGYKSDYSQFYPASTPRRLDSWDHHEKKERFAVLMGHITGDPKVTDDSSAFDQAVMTDLSTMEGVLKDEKFFALPEDHILRINNASGEDLKKAVTWLAQKA